MNFHDDPGAVFRKAMPDTPPPSSQLDLDKIVRDGYRTRNRHRALLGGSVTTGVAAIAAVLALSVTGLPGTDDPNGAANDPTESATTPPEEVDVTDAEMAGYPYDHGWGQVEDENGAIDWNQEILGVGDAATEAFGQLLADTGVWDDPANPTPEEDCSWYLDDGGSQEAYDECMAEGGGMHVSGDQVPGNYGQTYLRTIAGGESEDDGMALRTIFEFKVLLPGGWTAEPGPITEQLFPQHLISDGPYFTEDAPEFTTEDLDDGRTLMIADHGCAAEMAVVYPNGTGLRTTWNNCSGTDYPLDTEALKAATLAMPEFEFDTSTLAPVGELVEVPLGWVYDEDAWAYSEEAQSQARQTYDGARGALEEVFPGATLGEGDARSLGLMERGANMQRSYGNSGTLPYETTIDETTEDTGFELRYYLPGGWLPGFSETGHWDPHLTVCSEGADCNSWTDDDGTVWAVEEKSVVHEPMDGETWEPITEHEIEIVRYAPEGWAVGFWTSWQGDALISADDLGELLAAMPAPEYDAAAVPSIPAG
ncbi:MAG TPA: hypothetical protein VHG10_00425 [Glycomyces sp.]|nr:hypothetical protein [Glycomyces sp.]